MTGDMQVQVVELINKKIGIAGLVCIVAYCFAFLTKVSYLGIGIVRLSI